MTREIPLTRGMVALVDDEDFDWLSKFRWNLTSTDARRAYASRTWKLDGKWHNAKMHRMIMDAPKGVFVDHKNGDKLDNRRANLRLCTRTENARNAHRKPRGYRGVHKHCRRWRAMISIGNGKARTVGFGSAIEAAIAYDAMAREHHGEFAILNFPETRDWLFPDRAGTWPPLRLD